MWRLIIAPSDHRVDHAADHTTKEVFCLLSSRGAIYKEISLHIAYRELSLYRATLAIMCFGEHGSASIIDKALLLHSRKEVQAQTDGRRVATDVITKHAMSVAHVVGGRKLLMICTSRTMQNRFGRYT